MGVFFCIFQLLCIKLTGFFEVPTKLQNISDLQNLVQFVIPTYLGT